MSNYILNCNPSLKAEEDWTVADAVSAGIIEDTTTLPENIDLRETWWPADDQKNTGACVGFATAYGVLRWHYVKAGLMQENQKPSARFIWMANKETDNITSYPSTFLESEGTQTKLALRIAQRFGCVSDESLPMEGGLASMTRASFYTKAAKLRISSYHNLGVDFNDWKKWLAYKGPILTRLNVDSTWYNPGSNGELDNYNENQVFGGHAVSIVGYTEDYFIVRNSWGESWADNGFAYATWDYSKPAFTEAYGASL